MQKLDIAVNEKRPRWLRHILCMDNCRLPIQVVHCKVILQSDNLEDCIRTGLKVKAGHDQW